MKTKLTIIALVLMCGAVYGQQPGVPRLIPVSVCPRWCTCQPAGWDVNGKPLQAVDADGRKSDALILDRCTYRHVSRYSLRSKRQPPARVRAHAQQPSKTDPPKPLTPEQEASAAQKAFLAAAAKLDAAFAEYNTASAKLQSAFYKVLGENSIKPSECAGPGPDGKQIPFACITVDQTTGEVVAHKKVEPPKTPAPK